MSSSWAKRDRATWLPKTSDPRHDAPAVSNDRGIMRRGVASSGYCSIGWGVLSCASITPPPWSVDTRYGGARLLDR